MLLRRARGRFAGRLSIAARRLERSPRSDLVIIKIGWAYTPNDDRLAVERLVRETIAALQSEEWRNTDFRGIIGIGITR